MTVADVIVTKPGGLTTAEALAKKLPMVLIDPLPGQEELNAEFLERNGAAIQASDEKAAVELVVKVLQDDNLRLRMIKSMEMIRRPDAAREAAKHIMNLASQLIKPRISRIFANFFVHWIFLVGYWIFSSPLPGLFSHEIFDSTNF